MQKTQVINVMKMNPIIIAPEATLMEAARAMEQADCGVLPVGKGDKLEGIITDRDIVIRAVSKGKDVNKEKVRDYMTNAVCYCNETDTLEQAAEKMSDNQVARLIVKDSNGLMSGIITFGCILRKDSNTEEVSNIVECAVGRKAA